MTETYDGEHGTPAPTSPSASGTVARVEADPFADPGLPVHHPRRTDIDVRAARRAERQVAGLFGLSTLATIAFVVCFVLIDKRTMVTIVLVGKINALNFALGLTLGIALLAIGFGAIQWARKLMS